MTKRLFYFVLGLSLPFFIALAPQLGDRFKNASDIEREFKNVYQAIDRKPFRIETSTPTMDFMGEGEGILVDSNNALTLIVKRRNRRFMFSGVTF